VLAVSAHDIHLGSFWQSSSSLAQGEPLSIMSGHISPMSVDLLILHFRTSLNVLVTSNASQSSDEVKSNI